MSGKIKYSSTRKMIINKKQRKNRQNAFTVSGIILVIALLIGGIVFLTVRARPAKISRDFDPEDIVHDQPLFAVHEMSVFDPDTIPFLPKDGPQPKIAFSENEHNFGVIGLKDVVTKEFIIANQGDAPLTIVNAYTTCGCTTVEISASLIPPGKGALAKLVFDAGFHDSGGLTVKRGLIIESNDPAFPKSEIWTQATVRTTP
ncbi:MAG: DUF1573 domain-containing protein [Brevefilum sp.]|nr:DUF1573 domain-containing protein [Brevefilum sp.]